LLQDELERMGLSLNCKEGIAMASDPSIILVDLRDDEERKKNGVIPGSVHAPYPNLDENINFGVSAYSPSNNRSETITQGTSRITLDAYNANPTSMEVSIKAFALNTNKNGVVILGDMFELGAYTDEEHQKTVMLLEETNLEEILIVGEAFFKTSSRDSRIQKFKTLSDIKEYLKKKSFNNKTILLKGSRGMALEKLLELL
jgi:UDP-N-acetylmuramoyl-tripeptide--D-alanyl-D-alanine ligase